MAPSSSPADPHAPALERATTLGRYVILDLVGRGTMGEVYAAYDPELDRKVAIKLLRSGTEEGTAGRVRIMREAQAAAKLSHPNVVVVYDVGTLGDKVFIAMEFVEGHTLSYWLMSSPRAWADVLRVFVDAGRGLVAAHEKDLVHRDFKPDNVMVGSDGQVRVADFGLARVTKDEGGRPASPSVERPLVVRQVDDQAVDSTRILQSGSAAVVFSSTTSSLNVNLTQTGDMLGTPAYMSPEQHRGGSADAKSDQFSFCVALYEGLYGERPFPGNSLMELSENVLRGNLRPPPVHTDVPESLRRILIRGLQLDPRERYPSLRLLLAELENDRLVAGRDRFSEGAAAKLATVWEAPSLGLAVLTPEKVAVREAFLATGKDYAATVFETVRRALDEYATTWTATYIEACEATHLRAEQSTEVLDLRMAYLNDRLEELRTLCRILREANADVVANAVAAVGSLGSLERCKDVRHLRAVVMPPRDPRVQETVERLRLQLAEARVLGHVGRHVEAMRMLEPMEQTVRELGYAPLLAELLLERGRLFAERLEAAQAVTALEEAVWTAEAHRHDDVAAEATTYLIYIVGDTQQKFESGEIWARHAEAVLRRMGRDDRLWGWLYNNRSCMRQQQGRMVEALADAREAVAIKERHAGPENPDVAQSLINVALYLLQLGQPQEAEVHARRAVAITEAGLGPRHPRNAVLLSNYSEILNRLGRHEVAREMARRALDIFEQEVASEGFILSYPLLALGIGYLEEGLIEQALPVLSRAVALRESSETDLALRGEAHFALARAFDLHGDAARGRALALTAAAEYAGAKGTVAATQEIARINTWLAARAPRPVAPASL